MKVYVNFPDDSEELENRLAFFYASLVVEKIKEQNMSDLSKTKLLKSILERLNGDG